MAEILIENEASLVQAIRESEAAFGDFQVNRLKSKVERERKGWDQLRENRGKYTRELLNQIFDLVDFFEPNKRWFGSLLATPNRNLIFESSMDKMSVRDS